MTRPVNLYVLSRIREEVPFHRVEAHDSGSAGGRTKKHEMISLRILVDALMKNGIQPAMLDGFFLGYEIPHIGKEFDLLKFTFEECLNIELKCRPVPREQIRAQLIRNRYYLGHLERPVTSYTVVTDPLTVYRLTGEDQLIRVDFGELAERVVRVKDGYLTHIDQMFRASDYLVSPLHTPDKFIEGAYFLTQAQEQIKRKMLADMTKADGAAFFSLTGKPGTGKTLLLYDVARELAEEGETLIIHGGKLLPGHERLNEGLDHFTVIPAELLPVYAGQLHRPRYIFLDESHRLTPEQFELICTRIRENGQICVFSLDPEQILTAAERKNGMAARIRALPLAGAYTLSEKIRANRELSAFIEAVRDRRHRPAVPMSFEHISLAYANSPAEARELIAYYRSQGFVFIHYPRPLTASDAYGDLGEDFSALEVIGEEFDHILLVMDRSFYYDRRGHLQVSVHLPSDYLYPNLFYQAITRGRERIALIVVDAPELFDGISSIFSGGDCIR